MRLTTVHQILIAGAVVLAALYAVRSVVVFARAGQTISLLYALGGVVAALGAANYLRRFRAKLRAAEPRGEKAT